MTFWEFLDRQLARIRGDAIAGAGIFVLTAVILFMVAHYPKLSENELFKTLAQAIVVQGLVGLAMAAWFTRRPQGQPSADASSQSEGIPHA